MCHRHLNQGRVAENCIPVTHCLGKTLLNKKP